MSMYPVPSVSAFRNIWVQANGVDREPAGHTVGHDGRICATSKEDIIINYSLQSIAVFKKEHHGNELLLQKLRCLYIGICDP